jgi:hypothetical protein
VDKDLGDPTIHPIILYTLFGAEDTKAPHVALMLASGKQPLGYVDSFQHLGHVTCCPSNKPYCPRYIPRGIVESVFPVDPL